MKFAYNFNTIIFVISGRMYYSISVYLADGSLVQKYLAFNETFTVKRLSPGVQYKFVVRTVGVNFIESVASEPFTVTTGKYLSWC